MKFYLRSCKLRIYSIFVIHLVLLLDAIQYCATASVKTVRGFRPDVYIVTPEPSSSEARDFPYFLPTPLPDDKLQKPERYAESLPSKYAIKTTATTRRPFSSELTAFPPFQPTPLPERYTRPSTSAYVRRSSVTTKGSPDIIIAEFREGSSKNGKPNERMLSVKEMLSKEKVAGYSATTSAPTSTTYSQVNGKHSEMHVKDVWDIIKHNQDLETSTPMRRGEAVVAVNVVKSLPAPSRNPEYTVETVPSISVSKNAWSSAEPGWKQFNETLQSIGETIDEPRTIRGGSTYPEPARPARVHYYPAYSGQDAGYSSVDSDRYDLRPATGEAEDRYNPAQPYLPPHATKPAEMKRPAPPAPLPVPPVPMPPPPPPPPPQPYMNAPSVTYDAIPSYSPPDSSPPKPDISGPPSDSYSYQPPDDSGPPLPSFTSPSDDHHHHHHDHHDDGFKFEPPQSDSPGDQDSYPQLIFDNDHHSHHSSHEIDYHDLHEFYHHHHVHPPPPPTTTTTTTPAPVMEDTRVTNRFSYYYLGKKLWYLPLYFSVYFIIYVGALIIKSVARHKITYPQHYKTKRSLDWKISERDLHTLTRFTCSAILNAAEKYSGKS